MTTTRQGPAKKRIVWQSLAVQITLSILTIVLIGVGGFSWFEAHLLRRDMQREMGAQQASVAAYIGGNLDREVGLRLDALQHLSAKIPVKSLHNPPALQQLLAQLPVFQSLFNGGTFVLGGQGETLAAFSEGPVAAPLSPADASQLQAFLRSDQTEGVFLADGGSILMATPVYAAGPSPVGALVGVIRLDAPNFLDAIARSRYGVAGSYVLYSASQRRLVAASPVPPGTTLPSLEHLLRESPGTSIKDDHLGSESLITHIPLARAPWHIAVSLPTQEAFASLRELQGRLVWAVVAVVLVLGLACWVIVRRQLAALVHTTVEIDILSRSQSLSGPLPLTRQYEADQLITAFNRLLELLRSRNEALTSAVQLSQNTLDSIGTHIAVLNAGGQVMAINAPWRQFAAPPLHGLAPAGCTYHTLFDASCCRGDNNQFVAVCQGIASVLNGSSTGCAVENSWDRQGTLHWFDTRITPLGDGHQGAVVARTDITERKFADEQIRKLSQIAQQAPLSIVITDLLGYIEYTNPHFSEKTLFSAQEVLGKNPRILQSGTTPASVYEDLWQTLVARRVWRGVLHNRKKTGEILIERTLIAPVLNEAGQVTHYVALKEDVTQEMHAESHRRALSSRVEELSRRLVRTQEETRLRFSQELHDRTSPNLAALRINLDIIATQLREPDLMDRIEDTRALIEDTNASIREICAGLHPAAIERGGLLGVVRSYATQFSKRTGIQARVHCPHESASLTPDLELALFRIVQEALTNCAKHAHATSVDVRMQFDGRPIFLSVSDDGQGFDLRDAKPMRGLGLVSMRETVEFAGGVLRVESKPGGGTQIYVEI